MKAKMFGAVAIGMIVALAGWLVSCSSGSSTSPTAQVNVRLSDPPTCKTDNGFSHVWVTISEVRIHRSASASANDSGWINLTPGLDPALGGTPKQVDLLSLGGNSCLLVTLGANTEIPAGTYQQIRLILAPNSASVDGTNNCSSVGTNNCVVFDGRTSALELSSETTTGIKIPSGQISGGAFTIGRGQIKDLVIDFDACASIVAQGNNRFRLKPFLHAGEASLTSDAIAGQLIDSSNLNPIADAHSIVALELKDANGVDRVVMQTTADSNGNFVFCPVLAPPAGAAYDVVAVVETGSGASAVAYAATITSGIQPGTDLGKVPMNAPVPASALPGIVTGLVPTAGASGAISEDLAISMLEPLSVGGANSLTVPLTNPTTQAQTSVLSEATAPSSQPIPLRFRQPCLLWERSPPTEPHTRRSPAPASPIPSIPRFSSPPTARPRPVRQAKR